MRRHSELRMVLGRHWAWESPMAYRSCEAHASGVLETRRSRAARGVLSAFHSVREL
jgi:hypothetical protein